MKEYEIANIIIQWLKNDGWDVYKEVPFFGVRPDIIAVKHNVVWHIETKAHFNLDVLKQASRHQFAHRRFVGFEMKHNTDIHFIKRVCAKFDVGIIGIKFGTVTCFEYGKLFRKPLLLKYLELFEQYQREDVIAGGRGSYYSPYKITIEKVCDILKSGKKTIKEIMEELDGEHHYQSSTPDKSLANAILSFERDKIKVEKINNKNYYSLI